MASVFIFPVLWVPIQNSTYRAGVHCTMAALHVMKSQLQCVLYITMHLSKGLPMNVWKQLYRRLDLQFLTSWKKFWEINSAVIEGMATLLSKEVNTNLCPLCRQHVPYIQETLNRPMKDSILNHVWSLQVAPFCGDSFSSDCFEAQACVLYIGLLLTVQKVGKT